MMLLGTQDRDFFPQELNEKLAFVKEIGFDCFEVDGKVLMGQADELKEAAGRSGVVISSACGGYRGWIGDFIEERRQNGLTDLKLMIKNLKHVGGTGIVVPAAWGMFTYRLPPMVSPRSAAGDRKAILDSLRDLEETAGEYGIYIYLEPLNRYQDHMLNTTADAVSIIDEGGFKMVRITADFYHMAIEEDDISESLEKYSQYIGHIHIAENHRYQPGTGSIDFKRHMETLKRLGYQGAVVNEGRIRGEDPLKAYCDSIAYMKQFI